MNILHHNSMQFNICSKKEGWMGPGQNFLVICHLLNRSKQVHIGPVGSK